MNDKNSMNAEERTLAEMLEAAANHVEASQSFQSELEKKLMNAHKPKTGFGLISFKKVASTVGWTIGFAAMTMLFVWVIRMIAPQPQPAASNTPIFSCPVTKPNGSLPPGETFESPNYLGNDQIWTSLWPDGKVYMQAYNKVADGAFSMKWPWWRAVSGTLTIEGHRLDAQAEPLRADIPEGYGETGFQVSGLIFPTTGCWEVTGHVGDDSLTFVTEVIFGEAPPVPDNGINATPVKENFGEYDFRGGRLTLAQPLPTSPSDANIYLLQKDQQATAEDALALASRFGIQGDVFTAVGRIPNITEYAVSDGKQWLSMGSDNYFFYTPDMVKNNRGSSATPNENAESIIRDFLAKRGFNFSFNVIPSGLYGRYIVQPLAPDGLPMQYEYFSTPAMRVTLDENGEVLNLDANLMAFDQPPVGRFGIISAEEALQILLDDSIPDGKIETVHSGGGTLPQQWYREYADGEQTTIYGTLAIAPAVDPSKPTLLLIDGISAIGNTAGLEALGNYTYIEARGKFVSENGIRKFMVDSWDSNNIQLSYFTGSLHRDGDQIIFANDDGSGAEYPLISPPADVPLDTKIPESQLALSGKVVDGKLDWTSIQYFADASQMGGGGGGGGLGFYQLNLSGTPIPFPAPTQMPTPSADAKSLPYTVQEGDTLGHIASAYGLTAEQIMQFNGLAEPNISIGQVLNIPGTFAPPQLDGMRGTLSINIYTREDGSQRIEYGFISSDPEYPYMVLEGSDLTEELQKYQNKPIQIWGTAKLVSGKGSPVITVDKFEIPFPDLQFQILKGTEKTAQLDGNTTLLFTAENGTQYVELYPGCNNVIGGESMTGTGQEGEAVLLEVLAIPDITHAGYPTICVSSTAMANTPSGEPAELTIFSDKPNILPEPSESIFAQPNLTIEKVELIHYSKNLRYETNGESGPAYTQPVWLFQGHYQDGSEFEVLIQALKKEFLKPELESHQGPG